MASELSAAAPGGLTVAEPAAYYACNEVVYHGPYASEEEAYESFCAAEGLEPRMIVLGHQEDGHITGRAVWEG